MKNHMARLLLLLCAAAWSQVPNTANPYVRKPRKAAVSGEIGMNTLSSLLGIKGSFFLQRQVVVDAGLGLSAVGLRPGVQARYLFSEAKFSPFAYGGLKYGLGSGGKVVDLKDPDTQAHLGIEIMPSSFLDLGFGVDYLAHGGFYFTGSLGWSILLGGENYRWRSGFPSKRADDAARLAYGSGPTLGFSLGYAF